MDSGRHFEKLRVSGGGANPGVLRRVGRDTPMDGQAEEEVDRCPVFAADVSCFGVNVSSFHPNVSTFRANVSSWRPDVSSRGKRRVRSGGPSAEGSGRSRGGDQTERSARRWSTIAVASGNDARAGGVHRVGVEVFSFCPNVFTFRANAFSFRLFPPQMCSVGVDDAFGASGPSAEVRGWYWRGDQAGLCAEAVSDGFGVGNH